MKLSTILCSAVSLSQYVSATPVQWAVDQGGNGHFYQVVVVPGGVSWPEARDMAISMGGMLVEISDQSENAFVTGLAAQTLGAFSAEGTGPWIGAVQSPGNEPAGNWSWFAHGLVTFSAWGPGQPDNANDREHTAMLRAYGSLANIAWDDAPVILDDTTIYKSTGFIIEIDPSDPCVWLSRRADADATVSEKAPNVNYGNNIRLRLSSFSSSWEGGPNGRQRGLLRFNLAGTPPGILSRAILEVFQSDGIIYPDGFRVSRLFQQWDENTVTWNNQPLVGDPSSTIGVLANGKRQLLHLESTLLQTLVRSWTNESSSNPGIMLSFMDEYYFANPNGVRGDSVSAKEHPNFPAPRVFYRVCPCRADFDGNRYLDFFDISAFVQAYIANFPNADYNGDGTLNFFDFATFINEYITGCPE